MKKTYMIPTLMPVRVAQALPISTSPLSTTSAQLIDADATGAAMTKQNNYDVWADDWSK